VKAKVHNKKTQ